MMASLADNSASAGNSIFYSCTLETGQTIQHDGSENRAADQSINTITLEGGYDVKRCECVRVPAIQSFLMISWLYCEQVAEPPKSPVSTYAAILK